MLCLKVSREGQEPCIVGAENAKHIQISVHARPGTSDEAFIVAYSEVKESPEFTVGMRWLEESPALQLGDSVKVELIESGTPNPGTEFSKRGRRKTGSKVELYCSWCGKNSRDVTRLIAGPDVYICNECVSLCNEILSDESGKS